MAVYNVRLSGNPLAPNVDFDGMTQIATESPSSRDDLASSRDMLDTTQPIDKTTYLGDSRSFNPSAALGRIIPLAQRGFALLADNSEHADLNRQEAIVSTFTGTAVGFGVDFTTGVIRNTLGTSARSSLRVVSKLAGPVGVAIEVGADLLVSSIFDAARNRESAIKQQKNASFKARLNGVAIVGSF